VGLDYPPPAFVPERPLFRGPLVNGRQIRIRPGKTEGDEGGWESSCLWFAHERLAFNTNPSDREVIPYARCRTLHRSGWIRPTRRAQKLGGLPHKRKRN